MNEGLMQDCSSEEIKAVLDGMGDLKAPGSDGMPALFYNKFWGITGNDVVREVKALLNGGDMPKGWNETVVVLIPKVPSPEKLNDLRPINLCNVVYKIASKVLSNRLKCILPNIISLNQSAFVPGRLIKDNVMLAYELTHYMQNRRKGLDEYAALKLDMSKSYDRVKWDFLRQMMLKLGFHQNWVKVVMNIVSTVTYRVKVNGDLTDEIIPERGLRQGDPLSLYHFLICAEAFSTLLNAAEERGVIKGVRVCPEAPSINHLLFADDSLLLFKIDDQSTSHLQHILSLYEDCSGKMINKDKCSVMFSSNTREGVRTNIMQSLDIRAEARNEKYLGLPIYMGKSKVQTFNCLKDRIWKRIQGWKEKLLSKAGKDVLIKAVAQSIPTYAMSCFDLTKTLCDDIGMMIAHFLWSQQEKENKIHWLSWELMCCRKEKGGQGYRDLHLFNLAMLARQGWRLLLEPDSLCAQVLRSKYYPDGELLNSVEKPGFSYSWRSIVCGLKAVKEGMIWRVGDGTHINIWEDPWLPRGTTRRPITPRGRSILNKVSDLIDPYTGTWDKELIHDIFWEEYVKHILAIPIKRGEEDTPAWHYDTRGIFSVKSAYHVLSDNRDHEQTKQIGETSSLANTTNTLQWANIWNFQCQPKIKQFLWRLAHNSLPLGMNIKRRGVKDAETRCLVCMRLDEDGGHCFLKCKFVKKCWQALNIESVRICLLQSTSARDMVHCILKLKSKERALVVCFLWTWWDAMNKAYGEKIPNVDEVQHKTLEATFTSELLQRTTTNQNTMQQQKQCTWLPPQPDVLKINVDGAFQQQEKNGAWGFVVRDSDGCGM
jgi:hypothetical protein